MTQGIVAPKSHLLFLDECGNHDMRNVDPKFPLFLLAGLLVGETYYQKTLVPRVKSFKLKHCGATDVILHSSDIRRQRGSFAFLHDEKLRTSFYEDLNTLILSLRLRFFMVAVNKEKLCQKFMFPPNPYDVSLSQLLAVMAGPPLMYLNLRPNVTNIIAESRGRNEDKALQHEFQLLRKHGLYNYGASGVPNRRSQTVQGVFPSRISFVQKSRGVAGLELTDLAAYPIARAMINQNWDNPAAQIIMKKLKSLIPFP